MRLCPLPQAAGRQAPQKGSAPVAPEHMPGNHQSLDFTGTFIDLRDAGISVVALSWHLCHVPHATQDLDGLRGKTGTRRKSPTLGKGRAGAWCCHRGAAGERATPMGSGLT